MISETVTESRIEAINLSPKGHYLSVLVFDENVEHGEDGLQGYYLKLSQVQYSKTPDNKRCTSVFSTSKINDSDQNFAD